MVAPIVHEPNIAHPLALVRFACESWLHLLATQKRGRGSAVGGIDTMLAELVSEPAASSPGAESPQIQRLQRGYEALVAMARLGPANERTPAELERRRSDRARVEAFIRSLDDHLVQIHNERVAHLLSFYKSADIHAAAEVDAIDRAAFASAWAAGSSRSKYEVLDRGRLAAALAQQLGDGLGAVLEQHAVPRSPYRRRNTRMRELFEQTCDELIAIASLPPSSGGVAAMRYLAVIGEIALERIEHHMFGHILGQQAPAGLGAAPTWRLPRVLTRIGEISAHPDVAAAVWGSTRAKDVKRDARVLLNRILTEETLNPNRPRSLVFEAVRFLGLDDAEMVGHVEARLTLGRSAAMINEVPAMVRPFGERGVLSTREQSYAALVMAEADPSNAATVCGLLLREPDADLFDGLLDATSAARRYTAAYVKYVADNHGASPEAFRSAAPPLAAFVDLKPTDGAFAEDPPTDAGDDKPTKTTQSYEEDLMRYSSWLNCARELTGSDECVRTPTQAVWSALQSGLDDPKASDGGRSNWGNIRRRASRAQRGLTRADEVLAEVPIHARWATRSVVAQAVLCVDGTARREAIEALRQAGLARVAARLFELVVDRLNVLSAESNTASLDWLLEQAVFCLSYTGSIDGFQTLVSEAGLARWPDDAAAELGAYTLPDGPLPQSQRWIRTTALLGLADLGDSLHDDDSEDGATRITIVLESIEHRLRSMEREGGRVARHFGSGRFKDYWYTDSGGERRALAIVLAMLRSERPLSIDLMHVLSGRYLEPEVERSRAKDRRRLPFRVAGPVLDRAGVQSYSQEQITDRKAWDRWFKGLEGAAKKWDLVTWQFAEWGLERVATRFQHPEATSGVRFVPARQACEVAASRMRDINLEVVTIPAGWMPADAGRPEIEN